MAGMQTVMMLEKKVRVLHLYPVAARKRLSSRDLIWGDLFSTGRNFKAHPTVMHFLQQGHTNS